MLTGLRKVVLTMVAAIVVGVASFGVWNLSDARERHVPEACPAQATNQTEEAHDWLCGHVAERNNQLAGTLTETAKDARRDLRLSAIVGGSAVVVLAVAFALTGRRDDARPALRVEVASTPQEPSAIGATVRQRLAQLDSLRSDGLVTDDEYASRRTAILDAI